MNKIELAISGWDIIGGALGIAAFFGVPAAIFAAPAVKLLGGALGVAKWNKKRKEKQNV